jgi:uncharacterized protein
MRLLKTLSLAAAVAAWASAAPAQDRQLSIVTGGTGGVYYPLGGGFANILGKTLPGVTATSQVTGGSVANLQLIGSGKADIAFSQVDAAWDAINGLDKFTSGKLPIRALAVLYPNHMHVVTIEGTGISKVEDLKGKRVSTGSPGSATEVYAFRVIEAAGLDKDKDMTRERLGVAESVNALKDKISHFTPKMNAKYGPLYAEATIPKDTYKGMDVDAKNNTVWNILAVNASMSEDLAYQITKTMIEKRDELALVHKEALNIKPEWQTSNRAGIPWHPGALKYFKEKNMKIE